MSAKFIQRMRLTSHVIFEPRGLTENVAVKSVRSGTITLLGQVTQLFLTTVNTIILARLLSPSDFGLVGMVTIIVGFIGMFKNAGFSMAIIQTDTINHIQLTMLFWINVGISLFLGVMLFVTSPLIAAFYGKSELIRIVFVFAFSFIISGFSIQHQALLYRHMKFGILTGISISSQILSMIPAVLLAWFGWKYWALVCYQFLITSLPTLFLIYFCQWIPGLPQKNSDAGTLMKFGGHLTVSNVANYLSSNLDNLLIGRFIGADALGLYSKAYQLFLLPITVLRSPLVNVATPVLSSLKNQPDRYLNYYKTLINILTTITVPLSLYCAVDADFIITTLLGTQWIGAVPVFRILAISAIAYTLNGMQALVTMSMGYSARFMYWGIYNAVIYVTSFILGLTYGIEGVAMGFLIASYIISFISLFFCFHKTPISPYHYINVQIPAVMIGLLSSGCLFIFKSIVPGNLLIENLAGLLLFFGTYLGMSYFRKPTRLLLTRIIVDTFSGFTNMGAKK